MEKKPRYFLVGGNGELTEETTSEKLPKLSDKDIDKLYSKLIKLDSKYKNFKGSKRDYCFTVSGLIINFLKGNNLLGKEGGKLTDEQKAAKTAAQAKKFLEIKKKEGDWTEADIKEYFDNPTKTYNVARGELAGKYLEEIVPGFGNILGDPQYNKLVLSDIVKHVNKYKDVVELFCDNSGEQDIVSTKNFLLLAPFDQIFQNSVKGNEQKVVFRNVLKKYDRGTGYKIFSEWSQSDTATIITETDYYNNYLSKRGFKLRDKKGEILSPEMANVLMNAKVYSKFRSSGNIDFNSKNKIVELKGNIRNIRHREPLGNLRSQVDLTKLLGSLFNLFYVNKGQIRTIPKQGDIDFYNYTGDDDILKTKQSHLCTISLDILKLYNSLREETKELIKTILNNKISKLDLSNDKDTFTYTTYLKDNDIITNLRSDIIVYFQGTGIKPNVTQIISGSKEESMISLDINNSVIREKLYLKQINSNLKLKGANSSELLKDYCIFFDETGEDSRRQKLLNIIDNPTTENSIPHYIELEPDFIPEEYFTETAKQLLQPLVDDSTYTQDDIDVLIKEEFEDIKPSTKSVCDEVAIDLFNFMSYEDPDIPEITEEQVKKEQAEKEQAKKKLEKKKDKVIERYKKVEQLYNTKNSPIIPYDEIIEINDQLNELLESNKKTIKRIRKKDPGYEPPKEPKEPEDFFGVGEGKKGFGRRFYFKRF